MSTSSSETSTRLRRRSRLPWALFLALALLALVEAGVRLAVDPDAFPEHAREPRSSLRRVLDERGVAEIAFVGASVTRAGIVVPEVSELCSERLQRDFRVANYAHVGLRAELGEAVVRILLRESPRPRLMLCGVTPHMVRRDPGGPRSTAWIWTFADWRAEWDRQGVRALQALPGVFLNEVARHYRTFALREELLSRLLGRGPTPRPGGGPMSGGPLWSHERRPYLSIATMSALRDENPVRKLEEKMLATVSEDFVDPVRVEFLRSVRERCEDAGVELIFFELPLPDVHRELLPEAAYPQFLEAMEGISAETGVRFVSLDELAVEFGNQDFRDASHMNLNGATKMTRAIVDRVLVPELEPTLVRRSSRANRSVASATH